MIKLIKGCFTKIIVLIIIIMGVGYYVYVNYGDEISAKVKKEVLSYMTSEIDDKISELDGVTADEIKTELEKYLDELSQKDISVAVGEVDEIISHFENVLSDKQLNSEEVERLKSMLRSNEK